MISSNFDADSADPYDWDALARYVSGESSPEEANAVRAWLEARPDRARLITALRSSFDGLTADAAADVDVEGALRKVHARIAEPADATFIPIAAALAPRVNRFAARAATERARRPWRLGSVLAAAAALAFAAFGIWRSRTTDSASPSPVASPAATYATAVGARDSVRLSDGSRVILGPSSELTVAAGYGTTARAVELRGEAYFDVLHDATRPFTVHSAGATIVDVGTTFTVRGGPLGAVRVAVTSGSVRLSQATVHDSGVVLAAGDVGSLGASGVATVTRAGNRADDAAFTRGRLVFRDAPLSEVAVELRRWYGVELRIADSAIERRRLTATIERETAEQAMAVIGAALGAVVERHGDTATVRGAPGRRPPDATRTSGGDSIAERRPR